jgi:hypothetical protein
VGDFHGITCKCNAKRVGIASPGGPLGPPAPPPPPELAALAPRQAVGAGT